MVEFLFQRVDPKDEPRMKALFRLRYQVYCTECGFESRAEHPDGLEFDKYDPFSSHFCAMIKGSNEIIGTVRIILPSPDLPFGGKLPIENHCELNPDRPPVDSMRVGEISRLAISKDFRRREIDKAIYAQNDFQFAEEKKLEDQRREFECRIVIGLYQCVYHESCAKKLTHWYAVMVRGLSLLLKRWGIVWQNIGPSVEYHGLRAPYLADIEENEKRARLSNSLLLAKPPGWID